MEKQMNFTVNLKLEELALRRVVVNLWNEKAILLSTPNFPRKSIRSYSSADKKANLERWKTVEGKVNRKVSGLVIPESLKKRMLHIVKPIGSQILRWKSFNDEFDSPILEQLHWTSTGVIDYKKTAEKIVCLETIDVEKRYKLACFNCLEDYIPLLWYALPEDSKRHFNIEFISSEGNFQLVSVQLEFYWACVLNGKDYLEALRYFTSRTLITAPYIHRYLFQSSANASNKAATEYFFQKLTDEEQAVSLHRTISELQFGTIPFVTYIFDYENTCDIFCHLLSLMSPEQQMQVLELHSPWLLTYFLYWPWQDFLLDIEDFIWNFHSERYSRYLAYDICKIIRQAGYYFPNVIQKILLHSPSDFKQHFLGFFGSFFNEFFYYEDAETIEVFFKNVKNLDPENKGRLVLDSWFSYFINDLLMRDKWHLVEMVIREASLSKEEKRNLKDSLIYTIYSGSSIDEVMPRLIRFFKLLNFSA